MKIYRVIYKSILMDEGEDLVEVKTFLDRNLALDYIKEDESSYERYLDGRSMEDSVSIWLEDDEKMLQEKQQAQKEKEKDYEM